MNARHVYVHVPFCQHRCGYCGIHTNTGTPANHTAWHANVLRQRDEAIARWGLPPCIDTLYIGGGSPTVLSADLLGRVIADVIGDWPLSQDAEITVEVNPATLTPAHAKTFKRQGVTRISLGAQSFDTRALDFLQRDCRPELVESAVQMLRTNGIDSIGLDLIIGIPERDTPWLVDIDRAIALSPNHISAYLLTVEPGTPLAHRLHAGAFKPLDDTQTDKLLNAVEDRLAKHGFEQYEISNYARPGHMCRHNLNTWQGGDYLGLGPSACSRIGNERVSVRADGGMEHETLTPEADWTERMLFMARTRIGIDLETFQTAHPSIPPALLDQWQLRCRELVRDKLLCKKENRWVATRLGRRYADSIAEAFIVD